MKKKWLTAAIGAFVCSLTLGTALLFAPTDSADAANDQVLFSEEFTASSLDGSVWTATGDVSVVSTADSNNSDTLADWTATGAEISGETATISGGGYVYMPVSSNYTLTFNSTRSTTGAALAADDRSLLIGVNVQDPASYMSGAWVWGSANQNSNLFIDGVQNNDCTVGSWYAQDGVMTLTVADGRATLSHATHGISYQNFSVGTSGYVSFYVPSGAGDATLTNVSYVDNTAVATDNYKVAIGTQGGTLTTSNTVVPGYDARLGWDGATVLEYAVDLTGLGDATFTTALGDLSIVVTPDAGRYLLTMYDGDTAMELSSGNTNPSFVVDNKVFTFTARQNGGFSVNFNGVTYTANGAATSSPYGAIKFSVSEGADSAILIDDISLTVDEWDRTTVSAPVETTGFNGWTHSAGTDVSASTSVALASGEKIATAATYSDYVLKFTVANSAGSGYAHYNLYFKSSSATTPDGYKGIFANGQGTCQNNAGGQLNSANYNGSNTWFGQTGNYTLTVSNGEMSLYSDKFAGYVWNFTAGTEDRTYSIGTEAGYIVFEATGDVTISDVSLTYTTQVTDTNVYHTFEDESGKLYYAAPAQTGDTVAFASIAPVSGPKKTGYTFAGWAKDGVAVGETVANTADATYKPTYLLGEMNMISASLDGDIGLNFYMTLPAEILADSAAKVVFTIGDEVQEVAVNSTGKYTARVAAQDYDKDIVMTISTTAGEAMTYTSSVKAYMEAVLASTNENHVAVQPLAQAMLNYGAAAQDYFAEKTDVTVNNAEITAEVLGEHKPVLTSNVVDEGLEILGPTLMLESKTTLRFYFIAQDVSAVACSVDGVSATPKAKTSTDGTVTWHYVEVADIAVQDLDEVHTIKVGSYEMSISALGYVWMALYTNETIEAQPAAYLNAVRTFYLCNVAAEDYFNPSAEAAATPASYWDDDSTLIGTDAGQFDFVLALNGEEGRDAKILQLTDIQIIDSTQQRYVGRLGESATKFWHPRFLYENAFKYMREAVEKADPDLIVLSGDNTYGQFDDNGTMVKALIKEMDSYEIPWTLTWGNHDQESYLGTDWIISQYQASEYCRFSSNDGGITGSGNFTVGIVQNDTVKTAVFCVDSNGKSAVAETHPDYGCAQDKVLFTTEGIQADQITWISNELSAFKTAYGEIESIGFTHHPLYGQKLGLVENHGYAPDGKYWLSYGGVANNYEYAASVGEGNLDSEGALPSISGNGDFGAVYYEPKWTDKDLALHEASKAGGLVGWFYGHIHTNSASVLYDGVRYTNGLKVGTYDAFQADNVGGTLINMGSGMSVQHLYTDYVAAYPTV
ncbi:MAG: metallophosphoesterase [Clostridia bacterium]|nr:metallophosphoesterase [Clostridia bacterium]